MAGSLGGPGTRAPQRLRIPLGAFGALYCNAPARLHCGQIEWRWREDPSWQVPLPSCQDDLRQCHREFLRARAMPCLNSSGNVASDVSSTPRALRPFQVNATVTQRLSSSTESRTSAADCTVLRILVQPRPATRSAAKRQKLISSGKGRSAGQQDVLNIVKFEHDSLLRSA